ncbi:serine/threonine-protein kinase [Nocardiopsis composta]
MPPDAGGPGAEPRPLPTGFSPLEEADPRTIGPFRVVGRIGAGGMGAVYGALDGADRHVAVKVVHPRHADDPAFREQFAREAELLARVDAECAPAFYGADPHAETPWMATEFVPGRTLSGHVRERGVLGGRALLSFAAGTAEALAAIHAAGIVHRDVKPANVILAPGGPKVLDFGIARAADDRTPEEGVYGTPGWVAPERLAGEPETPGPTCSPGAGWWSTRPPAAARSAPGTPPSWCSGPGRPSPTWTGSRTSCSRWSSGRSPGTRPTGPARPRRSPRSSRSPARTRRGAAGSGSGCAGCSGRPGPGSRRCAAQARGSRPPVRPPR